MSESWFELSPGPNFRYTFGAGPLRGHADSTHFFLGTVL